jgi:hypothetical protein
VTLEMIEKETAAPHRFVMLLECERMACREIVSVAGEVFDVEMNDTSSDRCEVFEVLHPIFRRPAPPIIDLPQRVPAQVRKEIELAFQVFWTDYRVCASRLRTSLERLMDHFGVAKTRIQKNSAKPTEAGRRKVLDLSARIDKLPSKIGTHDYGEILHALRFIGNLGTHGDKVSRSAMLDAFRLYEIALGELFEDKSESAKAIIKRLKSLNKAFIGIGKVGGR